MKFFVYALLAGFDSNAISQRLAVDCCLLMRLPPMPYYFEIEVDQNLDLTEVGFAIDQEIQHHCSELSEGLASKYRPVSVSVTKI